MIDTSLQSIFSSIVIGSLYALVAFGLTLTLGSVRIYNWAYAEYLTIAAYVASILSSRFSLNIVLCFIVATGIASLVSVIVDEGIFKPLEKRGSTKIQIMLAAIAVGLLIRYIIYIIASVNNIIIIKAQYTSIPIINYGSLVITDIDLGIILSTMILMLSFYLILSRTLIGKQIRAMWDNIELAKLSGIKIYYVRRFIWLLVGIPAGIAGTFWSTYSTVTPTSGWNLLLPAFAATIVGGITSIPGAIIGGYILGFGENYIMFLLHNSFQISYAYKPLMTLFIMFIALSIRTGLIPINVKKILSISFKFKKIKEKW